MSKKKGRDGVTWENIVGLLWGIGLILLGIYLLNLAGIIHLW